MVGMNNYQQDPDQVLTQARLDMFVRAEGIYRRSPGAEPAQLVDMLDRAMGDIAADDCPEAAAMLMACARHLVDRAAATPGAPARSPAAIGEEVGDLAEELIACYPALVPDMVAERLGCIVGLIGEGRLDEPGVALRTAAVLVAAACELLDMYCSVEAMLAGS